MLIELMAYYIGAPMLKPSESFWIYTNLNEDNLARVIQEMMHQRKTINQENLISVIKNLSNFPGHEWIHAERVEDYLPVKDVDANLN